MNHAEIDQAALAAQDPTGRLYNNDLRPAAPSERRWKTYSLFSLWMNDAHNVGNYTFAAGLFLLGLSPIQVTLGILGGALIIFGGCCLSGFMGHDTGAPYPVVSRLSWGIWGARFTALVRGIVAIAWYGIQTFLASIALKVLLVRFFPGLESLTEISFLGMDLLGWIAFLALWAIQLVIVRKGMEAVRHFQGLAGPAIWAVMIALAVWMLWQADWSISWTRGGGDTVLSSGQQWYQTFAAVGLTVGVLATLMLNFSDFARFSPSRADVVKGNAWGLPFNWTAFALTSVLVSAASVEVYGEAVLDPAALLEQVDNEAILLAGSFVFVVATIGVNIVANFVSAAFDLSNLNPKRISFRTGGIIASAAALVSTPWNLYNSPQVIAYFLGGLGALLGPFFGIMAVDYFLFRKARVSIPDLYEPSAKSIYYYRNGLNPLAVKAFVPSSVIALTLALVPAFAVVAPFGWFIGAALGAVLYRVIARGKLPILPAGAPTTPAGSGEPEPPAVRVSPDVPPPGEEAAGPVRSEREKQHS
ncbi:MAG: NCS1 family nucleobase:cation symporter-1 [Actinomycetes bacterium]